MPQTARVIQTRLFIRVFIADPSLLFLIIRMSQKTNEDCCFYSVPRSSTSLPHSAFAVYMHLPQNLAEILFIYTHSTTDNSPVICSPYVSVSTRFNHNSPMAGFLFYMHPLRPLAETLMIQEKGYQLLFLPAYAPIFLPSKKPFPS